MKKLILFIFLTTCSVPQSNVNSNNYDFDFKNENSFVNFKNKLIEYSKNTAFPRIDSR